MIGDIGQNIGVVCVCVLWLEAEQAHMGFVC